MKLLQRLDDLLNHITMYKLLATGLSALVAIAVIFCFMGVLSLSTMGLLASCGILFAVCYATNSLFAWLYHIPASKDSSLITSLILICILPQATTPAKAVYIGIAGMLAIASKYLIVWRHKHLFNPAAFGAAVMGLSGLLYATWWIGNPSMLPFTLILGLLVLRKIRRFSLFIVFVVTSLVLSTILTLAHGQVVGTVLHNVVFSGPLLFLGMIMLTEPSTMPPSRYYQILYGILVGVLFASTLHVGGISITPQFALLLGNIFAYSVSFKQRLRMTLIKKHQLAPNVYDFTFRPSHSFRFIPGQYMEWTLGHTKVDWRGNRRTFTIASSPTEKEVHLGIKFYEPGSSFKAALQKLQPGDSLQAGQIAGDFILPADKAQKLVWIAGGIGITPFRSMAQYLLDAKQTRDIVLFYFVSRPEEKSFHEVLEAAKTVGLKVIYVLPNKTSASNWAGERGRLTKELLAKHAPDYLERRYYISGANAMVHAQTDQLRSLGIPRTHIITDYFSGY